MPRWCNRYPKLIQCRKLDQLDVADVAKKMDEVNMGRMTVQTMIFEPAALKLHLAIGSCPSSALPMKLLELGAAVHAVVELPADLYLVTA